MAKNEYTRECKDCDQWIEPKGKKFGAVWGECPEIQSNDLIQIYVENGDGIVQTDIHPTFGCRLWKAKDKEVGYGKK